jgi:hypothetical protein
MGPAKAAVLFELQLLWRRFFVLCCRVISLLALSTGKRDYISHYHFPLTSA